MLTRIVDNPRDIIFSISRRNIKMATTTFSGPIKAGTISNTTGTTLGDHVRNTGQVVMSQSIMIDAAVAAGIFNYLQR